MEKATKIPIQSSALYIKIPVKTSDINGGISPKNLLLRKLKYTLAIMIIKTGNIYLININGIKSLLKKCGILLEVYHIFMNFTRMFCYYFLKKILNLIP